ncbi:hypothetical protein ACFLQN_01600 [Candidatus Aenigmatarchaeota archaeon]
MKKQNNTMIFVVVAIVILFLLILGAISATLPRGLFPLPATDESDGGLRHPPAWMVDSSYCAWGCDWVCHMRGGVSACWGEGQMCCARCNNGYQRCW